jgi:hypothetical protein
LQCSKTLATSCFLRPAHQTNLTAVEKDVAAVALELPVAVLPNVSRPPTCPSTCCQHEEEDDNNDDDKDARAATAVLVERRQHTFGPFLMLASKKKLKTTQQHVEVFARSVTCL